MSYSELRLLAETMRSLGYPRLISMESFRVPNFELVADILYWLLQHHDPSAEIDDDVRTEAARIMFLKSIAELIQVKLRVRLNCRWLYQADGYAARELLKLAKVLHKAMDLERPSHADRDIRPEEVTSFDCKAARTTASELTADGAKLGDFLQAEMMNGELRSRIVTQPQDLGQIDLAASKLIKALMKDTEQLGEALAASIADEESLQAKIESKRTQVERMTKKLRALEATRPAHQEEYEKLEAELAQQYGVYLEHFRNLEFLAHELGKLTAMEERLMEEHANQLRVLREKLRREEVSHLREADRLEEAAAAQAAAERTSEPVALMRQALVQNSNSQLQLGIASERGPEVEAMAAQPQAAIAMAQQVRPVSGRRQREPSRGQSMAQVFQRHATLEASPVRLPDSDDDDDDMLVGLPSDRRSLNDVDEGEDDDDDDDDDDGEDDDDDSDDTDSDEDDDE